MGANQFACDAMGANPNEAFENAKEYALHEYGHGGYTGSIAEKNNWVLIPCPKEMKPHQYAQFLINTDDQRIGNKWGPAGCIDQGNGWYLFFGWASN